MAVISISLVILILISTKLGFFYPYTPPPGGINANFIGTVTSIRSFENSYGGGNTYRLSVKVIRPSINNLNNIFIDISDESYLSNNISVGTIISAKGVLEDFDRVTNPGQFDSRTYYRNEQYSGSFKAENISVLPESAWHSLRYFIPHHLYEIRSKIIANYKLILGDPDSGTLSAMVMGDKSGLSDEIKNLYRDNSISHLLAISGLHVSLIGVAIYELLKRLKCSFKMTNICAILFLFLYGALTGFSVSTSRAVMMMIVCFAAGLFGRSYDLPSALSLSAVLILTQNPLMLYQTGFQLSFLAVIGIYYIYPEVKYLITGKIEVRIIKPHYLTREERIKGFFIEILHAVFESLLASISVFIVTAPVLLNTYYYFILSGFLLNIIVIPLMSILVITGLVGGVVSLLSIDLGTFFLGSSKAILVFYTWLCKIGAMIPHNRIILGKPAAIQVGVYYFIVVLFFYILRSNRRSDTLNFLYKICHGEKSKAPYKRLASFKRAVYPVAFCIALFVLSVRVRDFRVTMLDVGQGDSFIIEDKKNTYISDSGSTSKKNIGTKILVPYLEYRGIDTVSAVFISHMDKDHINGILELLNGNEIKVRTVFISSVYKEEAIKVVNGSADEGDSMYSEELVELMTLCVNKKIPVNFLKAGWKVNDGSLRFTAIYPYSDTVVDDANDASIIMRLDAKNFSMLFTGDASTIAEDNLLSHPEYASLLDVDILKCGHHGSKYSSGDEFLSAVSPKLTMISCGLNNRYGHPHEETMERLYSQKTAIARTDKGGYVTLKVKDGRIILIHPEYTP